MLDDRRNFLTAISGCVGALCFWRPKKRIGPPRPRPEPKPRQPRWEWEVSEWRVRIVCVCGNRFEWAERDYRAKVTAILDEAYEWLSHVGSFNRDCFLGETAASIQVAEIDSQQIKDGLTKCEVHLVQQTDLKKNKSETFAEWEPSWEIMCSFHDLFRGEHAIVSVGGKEV